MLLQTTMILTSITPEGSSRDGCCSVEVLRLEETIGHACDQSHSAILSAETNQHYCNMITPESEKAPPSKPSPLAHRRIPGISNVFISLLFVICFTTKTKLAHVPSHVLAVSLSDLSFHGSDLLLSLLQLPGTRRQQSGDATGKTD